MNDFMFSHFFLIIAAILSAIAGLLHIAIIFGGEKWYYFFGAGHRMANAARNGRWYPALITFCIAAVLFLASAYALAGAQILPPLPFLTPALLVITSVYVLRGLWLVPMLMMKKQDVFMLLSSIICLGYGLIHLLGLWQFFTQR